MIQSDIPEEKGCSSAAPDNDVSKFVHAEAVEETVSPTIAAESAGHEGTTAKEDVPDASARDSVEKSASAESPKIEANTSDLSDEWNLVVVPASEGEPSIVPEKDQVSAANIPQEQVTAALLEAAKKASSGSDAETPQVVGIGVDGKPVAIADFQELQRLQEEGALKGVVEVQDGTMNMLRKGAVAALGGSMVGLGLVMIPLPVPLGVVVASSGMAMLASEFDSAREMNDKIMATTKRHWEPLRDKVIQNIEEMGGEGRPTNIEQKNEEKPGARKEEVVVGGEGTSDGIIIPILTSEEQRREEELAKQRAKAMRPPNFMDQMRLGTGRFLARHFVPLLKREKEGSDVSSIPGADITVQSDMETSSDIDQIEEAGAVETKSSGLAQASEEREREEEILSQPVAAQAKDENVNLAGSL